MLLVAQLINHENVNLVVPISVHDNVRLPLDIAVCEQQVSATMVQWLIDQGATVNINLGRGFTPLMRALNLRRHAAAEVLIGNGADLFAVNEMGESIMHYAVRSNDRISLQHLIDHGVGMDSTNNSGNTPLYDLYNSNFHGHYPFYNGVGTPPNAGPDFALTTQNGGTPFHLLAHFCSSFGLNEVITRLIEKGFNINAQNNLGNTPLHNAVTGGRASIVNDLLQYQPSIDVKNNNQETPLALAHRLNKRNIVQLLENAQAV
ncbi:MAG: ankyrin repeat domain-containing protein [Amoebophilaceae bacterium]|nr:ankyrin repeat domain-containing protein [Amoebophilaceae bacterium]